MVERNEFDDAPGPLVRLQKLLAMSGVDSRRHCEEYIVTGRVTVDGVTVRELGVRVNPRQQEVRLDGERVVVERKVYYVLNKPPGFLCTNRDPAGRSRAIDLFPKGEKRLFTVGRLDEDSQGLLLVTNDGEMAHRLAHPRFRVAKVYRVQVAGIPAREMLAQLKTGMQFAEGKFRVNDARLLRTKGDSALVELSLMEGQNREIRRLLARLGHKVLRLERVELGPLNLGTLPLGRYRPVTQEELKGLQALVSGRAVRGPGGTTSTKSRRRERDGLVESRAAKPQAARRARCGDGSETGRAAGTEENAMSEVCELPPLPGLCSTAMQRVVRVVEQVQLARDTFRVRLESPEIARQIVPGQFVMIREPGTTNPLLGRPFALYDTYLDANGEPTGIDVVYLVLGKMTRLMSGWRAGDAAELWGPLGNGFPCSEAGQLLFVAGGIGVTPFLAVAREAMALRKYGVRGNVVGDETPHKHATFSPPTLCYGVRSAEYLSGLDDFAALGVNVQIATDDGTRGHHGFVTDLVQKTLAEQSSLPPTIYCCGPEPMMHAVAKIAAKHNAPCYLSLETPMACGFGACFSCVTRVRLDDNTWDYRRVCMEGPVFPAQRLAW